MAEEDFGDADRIVERQKAKAANGYLAVVAFWYCVSKFFEWFKGSPVSIRGLDIFWLLAGLAAVVLLVDIVFRNGSLQGSENLKSASLRDGDSEQHGQTDRINAQLLEIVKRLDRMEYEQGLLHEHLQEICPPR